MTSVLPNWRREKEERMLKHNITQTISVAHFEQTTHSGLHQDLDGRGSSTHIGGSASVDHLPVVRHYTAT